MIVQQSAPQHSPAFPVGSGRRYADRLVRVATIWMTTLLVWQDRANQRHQLGELSDFMLRDIGISPELARSEAAKPFWQA